MVELKRNLGFWTVFSITITAMIGTGLFFGISIAAGKAGNASILAWILLGCMTVYVGACFGELTSMYPRAGGIYEFAKHAYGKGLFSFIIGWTSWIVINMMNSLLIVAALEYIMPPDTGMSMQIGLAILIIVILNFIAYLGTESIATVLGFFAIIILVLMLTLIGAGTFHVNVTNYQPIFTMPWWTIFLALFFIVETFFGWENASFMAEETMNPEKTIPRALIWSTVFVSLLGILLAVVLLGIVPWSVLATTSTPILTLSSQIFSAPSAIWVKLGIALALIGSAAGGLIGSPRLLLGMARDKLFIEQLADIHPRFQTPYKAILFQAVISALVIYVGFGNYTTLLGLLVPIALIMYVGVIMAVPILRFKNPTHPRPFKAWFGKVGPVIVSIIYLIIIVYWLGFTPGAYSLFKLGLSFILIGIPIFLLLLFYYDPEAIRKISDSFAWTTLMLEGFHFPKNFRRDLLSYFDKMEDKTVLDYGAGVGTLTLYLSENVGPKGKIYATELSQKNIEILANRLIKKNINNVEVIHDEHQINRIHPNIKNVDAVFSVGMLGYVQDVHKVLKDIHRILPMHGKICMVEYVDYFWIMPNVKWLSDNEVIKKVFNEAGFAVTVTRKRRFFWSYLIIYGIKTSDKVPYI